METVTSPGGVAGRPWWPERDQPRTAGTMLAGRYRIVGLLGRGGMGEVYRADDLKLAQPVALKFLPGSVASEPAALARFHNEVRVARQVSHPNVCRIYDLTEADGEHFLSMEYIDGEDLSSLLRRIGRLPADKAVQSARQICAGLAAAHDLGVLHRDLKPANVMLDGRGSAKIMDFGLADFAEQIKHDDIAGTPAYMAPEQLAGGRATISSDLYALGLVLFEMFTGAPAFAAGSAADRARASRDSAPPTPSQARPDIDPAAGDRSVQANRRSAPTGGTRNGSTRSPTRPCTGWHMWGSNRWCGDGGLT
jgi:serine/threonine-protein kinase